MESTYTQPNLTINEGIQLNKLRKDTSLVIRGADKGSCIVIEKTSDYVKNGLEHLSDPNIYKEIPMDYTLSLVRRTNTLINNLKHFDKITRDYLASDEKEVRTQQLYFLKKVHKTPMSIRPIVSGCSGPTEKLSNVVDIILKKGLEVIPAYLRDTKQFIQTIERTKLPKDALLVTLDVTGLYLNIPQLEGITRVLDYFYSHFPDETTPRHYLEALMRIILEHNIFKFAGKMFKQICGTAMGTKFAPTFANLYMASVEEDFLSTQTNTPIIWKRYIDDIFMVWTHGLEDLHKFIQDLNKHSNLKYTHNISDSYAEFLDAVVHKDSRFNTSGILDIKPYFKNTNKFQYTHFRSAHPRHTFGGLVKGESIRILRLSSDKETYTKTLKFLHKKFKARDYPYRVIRKAMNKVPFNLRQKYLEDKDHKELDEHQVPYVCAYQPQFKTSTHRNCIKDNSLDKHILEQPLLAYKKGTTLANHLVRARLRTFPDPPRTLCLLPNFPNIRT